jgi:MFS family permease
MHRDEVQRRVLRVLVLSQVLAGAGLAAGVTVGALLAEDMLGSTAWAGVSATLFTVGAAAAASGVGRLSSAFGRRTGLATGYAVGAAGAGGVVVAAALDSVLLLLPSMLLYGSGLATNLQARYAGADLAPADRRGRAVSTVLVATTVGAVAGPNLVGPTGRLAAGLGMPELAGPFLLAAAAYALAAAVVVALLRPDPLLTARRRHEDAVVASGAPAEPDVVEPGGLRLAATAMVTTQLVMVAIMTMTPIHMRDHGHSLSAAGLVISLHIAAMYLPSPLSGRLADRIGRRPVLAAAGVSLLAAGVVAAVVPAHSVAGLAVALVLLGLGWNLGLIGGTALVTDAVPLARRARTQGSVDLAVALSGAAGGMSAGAVMAVTSYAVLSLSGGLMALALVPLLLRPGGTPPPGAGTPPAVPVPRGSYRPSPASNRTTTSS